MSQSLSESWSLRRPPSQGVGPIGGNDELFTRCYYSRSKEITMQYLSTIREAGFYWVLPARGEAWEVHWLDQSNHHSIKTEYPGAEFYGPIPQPPPKKHLGRGVTRIKGDRSA